MRCTICGKDLSEAVRVLGTEEGVKYVHRAAHYSGIMEVINEIIDSVANFDIYGSVFANYTVRDLAILKNKACVVKSRLKKIDGDIFE